MNGISKERTELLDGKVIINHDDVRKFLDTPASSILVIAGSLLEGIGNAYSDIDAYVIGNELATKANIRNIERYYIVSSYEPRHGSNDGIVRQDNYIGELFTYRGPSGLALNVEYWTFEDVRQLIGKVRSAYLQCRISPIKYEGAEFSYKDRMFVHRLRSAIPLKGASAYKRIIETIDYDEFCFLMWRQLTGAFAPVRDIAGAWDARDYGLACSLTSSFLSEQVFAFTFLVGDSNQNPKWLPKKLQRLPQSCRSIGINYFATKTPATRTPSEMMHFLQSSFDVLDAVFEVARDLLNGNAKFFTTEAALGLLCQWHQAHLLGKEKEDAELFRHFLYYLKPFLEGTPSCQRIICEHAGTLANAYADRVRSLVMNR
jgi:hypothetical protein